MIKNQTGGIMANLDGGWQPVRDAFDIVITGVITALGGIIGWSGRRLMKHIDSKVGLDVFQQHQRDVMDKFSEYEKRHNEDRKNLKDEMREVNKKLDKVIDYLIQRRDNK
jgi:DNA gyrase/topoisomerase IV subunit A